MTRLRNSIARVIHSNLAILLLAGASSALAAPDSNSYSQAHKLYEKKQYREAIKVLNQYMPAHATDANALRLRGYSYWHAGDPEKACADLKKLLALAPQPDDVKLASAEILLASGRVTDAVECLESISKSASVQLQSRKLYVLAYCCNLLKQPQRGMAALKQSLASRKPTADDKFVEASLFLQINKLDLALACVNAGLKLAPKHKDLIIVRTLVLSSMGKHEEALKAYEAAIKGQPRTIDLLIDHASVFYALGYCKQAADLFTQAIGLAPRRAGLYSSRALALYNLRQYDNALTDCTKALSLDPNLIEAYKARCLAYASLRKWEAVLAPAKRVLSEVPNDFDTITTQLDALVHLNKIDEAFRVCELWEKRDPAHKERVAIKRADIYVYKHEFQKALAALEAIPDTDQFPQAYRSRATIYFHLRQNQESKAYCLRYLALHPRDLSMLVHLADCDYALDNFQAVIEDTDAALKVDPINERALYLKALAYWRMEKPELAASYVERVLKMDKQHGACYQLRGRLRKQQGKYALALADIKKAMALKIDAADCIYHIADIYIHQGKYDLALAEFDKLKWDENNLSPSFYLLRGQALIHAGKPKQAIADMERIIKKYPKQGGPRGLRINMLRSMGTPPNMVLATLNADLKEVPDDVDLLLERARINLSKRDHDAALRDYDRVITLQPKNGAGYMGRARVYRDTVQPEKAVLDFRKAANLHFEERVARHEMASMLYELKEYDKAIAELTSLINTYPKETKDLWNFRGKAYSQLGDSKRAISDFTRQIAETPDECSGYRSRAMEYMRTKQYKEAVKDLDHVLAVLPRLDVCMEQRAEAHLLLGNYKLAVQDFTGALAARPMYPPLYEGRAKAYEKLGQVSLANRDRSKAKRLAAEL